MNKLHIILGLALTTVSVGSSSAVAQARSPNTREYSRKGELSPGTEAPSLVAMVAAIENGSPEKLKATLEYGERVLCEKCVPLLQKKLLSSGNHACARWRPGGCGASRLRRRTCSPACARPSRTTPIPTRRARAAEALGEFMDNHALGELSDAALADPAPEVRAAAVRGLARLNSEQAGEVVPDALQDGDASVRLETLSVLMSIGSFRDYAALLPLLGDTSAEVRTRTARLCGEYRVADAETALAAMLLGDDAAVARKAAAWALGRIGGSEGRGALLEAKQSEQDPRVLDALDVASRMK